MKRLTLEELKAKKNETVNLETIKGGNANGCHVEPGFWETIGWMIKMNYEAKLQIGFF